MGTLELKAKDESEFIYLPSSDIEIEKALMRLGVPYLQDCEVSIDSHDLPDNALEMIPKNITTMERVDSLNKVANKFMEMKGDIHKKYVDSNKYLEYPSGRSISY